MSTELIRGAMTPVGRKVRAYFAPAGSAIPVSGTAEFPPSGWTDLGWIENLRRTPGTRIEAVRAGTKAATVTQFAAGLDARVEFDFLQWGKLQMALTGCGPHLNVLASAQGAPLPASLVLAGSSATELLMPVTDAYSIGDLVAVDVDYTGQTGYVGTGVPGAYVKNAADVQNDVHYVRRVTFNVARVSMLTPMSLRLQQPLLCGPPPQDACVQRVMEFVDREGGSFFLEWSALFVMESESGGRVTFQYPRLQVSTPAQESSLEIAAPLQAMALHASLRALPQRDPIDGEQVLCYRSYLPAAGAAVY